MSGRASTSGNTWNGAEGRKTTSKRAVLSCSECRRLKLKCDRGVPCGSCVKRGLSHLCPEGSLAPTRTSKLAASATALAERVELLETILRDHGLAHAVPALPAAANVAIDMAARRREAEGKGKDKVEEASPPAASVTGEVETLSSGVGSLTLREDGSYRFLGTSASLAYRGEQAGRSEGGSEVNTPASDPPKIGPDFAETTSKFPFSTLRMSLQEIRGVLPPRSEAIRLSGCYWDYCSFMFRPISPEEYWEDYFESAFAQEPHGPKLACVLMVLALGAQFDPAAPPTNTASHHYFTLGQAALAASKGLAVSTLPALQALHLCGNLQFNRDERYMENGEAFFPVLGMAVKMAQSMGLHRDPRAWDLEEVEARRRRNVFWELFTLDRLQSFLSGRPYTFHAAHFDTSMPEDASDAAREKYGLALFVGEAIDSLFSVKTPSYSTLTTLEQKLRRMYAESAASTRCSAMPATAFLDPGAVPSAPPAGRPEGTTLKIAMEQHTWSMLYTIVLAYMHKSSFAQALARYSEEPLQSPWAMSVKVVILEASTYIVKLARSWFELEPVICPRWWHIHFHLFVAGLSQTSLITTSPTSMLASHAWSLLNETCSIFEAAAPKGAPGALLLPRILVYRQQAYEALSSARRIPAEPTSSGSASAEMDAAASLLLSLGTTTQLSRTTGHKRCLSTSANGGEKWNHTSTSPRATAESTVPPQDQTVNPPPAIATSHPSPYPAIASASNDFGFTSLPTPQSATAPTSYEPYQARLPSPSAFSYPAPPAPQFPSHQSYVPSYPYATNFPYPALPPSNNPSTPDLPYPTTSQPAHARSHSAYTFSSSTPPSQQAPPVSMPLLPPMMGQSEASTNRASVGTNAGAGAYAGAAANGYGVGGTNGGDWSWWNSAATTNGAGHGQ
ncbi:hypothetical protein JCM11641_000585 [Rhodosporidiobolus odoratus]